MRRHLPILLTCSAALGIGGVALAQDGRTDALRIELPRQCLTGTRVTIRIVPPRGAILSPVQIRAADREVVRLTGVTAEASVSVRLPRRGRVSVSGETTGGETFFVARDYRPCAPAVPLTGGGEG